MIYRRSTNAPSNPVSLSQSPAFEMKKTQPLSRTTTASTEDRDAERCKSDAGVLHHCPSIVSQIYSNIDNTQLALNKLYLHGRSKSTTPYQNPVTTLPKLNKANNSNNFAIQTKYNRTAEFKTEGDYNPWIQ